MSYTYIYIQTEKKKINTAINKLLKVTNNRAAPNLGRNLIFTVNGMT